MAPFNPYHAWLAIHPAIAQPDYFQLLSLDTDVCDAQLIDLAASRAAARVRRARPGDRRDDWARLLDEIDAARRCLIDPEARAEYLLRRTPLPSRPVAGPPAPASPEPTRPPPSITSTIQMGSIPNEVRLALLRHARDEADSGPVAGAHTPPPPTAFRKPTVRAAVGEPPLPSARAVPLAATPTPIETRESPPPMSPPAASPASAPGPRLVPPVASDGIRLPPVAETLIAGHVPAKARKPPEARSASPAASREQQAPAAHREPKVEPSTPPSSTVAESKPQNPSGGERNKAPTRFHSTEEGYELLRRIGAGQYAEVWHAVAPGGVHVALKKVRFPLDHQGARSELRSLELVKCLRHPFLVQIHAFWAIDNQLTIVMELADGTLENRSEECREAGLPGIPVAELLGYMQEAAEALDYLHSQDVLHRDIKPANILLANGHAKVADLGIAAEGSPGAAAMLVTRTTLGTPLYMAPETWEGKAGPCSDQYSLAVSYFELRTGSALDLASAHNSSELIRLPRAERNVVKRALAPKPDDRYDSCGDFVRSLVAVHASARRPASAANWPLLAILVLILLVLAVIAWSNWPSPEPPLRP